MIKAKVSVKVTASTVLAALLTTIISIGVMAQEESAQNSGRDAGLDAPGANGAIARSTSPNIVLILADDLGWSDLGCYGGEIPTPNIDALAARGLRFTQFYNNAVCGPSRASLLTGLYAQRVGHTGKHWNEPTDYSRCFNLGEVLQRAGYQTMMVGKWQDPDVPVKRGFHRFFGPMCAGKISYFDEVKNNPFFLDGARVKLPEDFYLTDALTNYALKFLKEATEKPATSKKPFFLYVAHLAPHWPLHAREGDIAPHRSRYQQHGWDGWRNKRLENQRALGLLPAAWSTLSHPMNGNEWTEDTLRDWHAERMAVYAAQVASVDHSTGRIVKALKESGQMENTLIIFLSDNGAAPDGGITPSSGGLFKEDEAKVWRLNGEGLRLGSGPENLPGPADSFQAYGLDWALMSNTPFRSTKMTGYEGGIRTPMIAHWPAGISARGEITNHVGHVIDLMPTVLEVAGASYPGEPEGRKPLPVDGLSLTPAFRGEVVPARDFLAWRVPQSRALRAGDWKIISGEDGTPWELYNLAADGTETTNLASRHPDKVKRLVAKWGAWIQSCAYSE